MGRSGSTEEEEDEKDVLSGKKRRKIASSSLPLRPIPASSSQPPPPPSSHPPPSHAVRNEDACTTSATRRRSDLGAEDVASRLENKTEGVVEKSEEVQTDEQRRRDAGGKLPSNLGHKTHHQASSSSPFPSSNLLPAFASAHDRKAAVGVVVTPGVVPRFPEALDTLNGSGITGRTTAANERSLVLKDEDIIPPPPSRFVQQQQQQQQQTYVQMPYFDAPTPVAGYAGWFQPQPQTGFHHHPYMPASFPQQQQQHQAAAGMMMYGRPPDMPFMGQQQQQPQQRHSSPLPTQFLPNPYGNGFPMPPPPQQPPPPQHQQHHPSPMWHPQNALVGYPRPDLMLTGQMPGFPPASSTPDLNNDFLHLPPTRTREPRVMNPMNEYEPPSDAKFSSGGASSRYRGVFWDNASQAFRAKLKIKGRTWYLGIFQKQLDAARKYDAAARYVLGPAAILNFKHEYHRLSRPLPLWVAAIAQEYSEHRSDWSEANQNLVRPPPLPDDERDERER